jgi:BSD domain
MTIQTDQATPDRSAVITTTPSRQGVDDEMRRRRADSSTYTVPILIKDTIDDVDEDPTNGSSIPEAQNEARAYLQSFDVIAKTDDIIQILQQEEDVRRQFEALVPLHVSYEQFWARFFFQCDPDRINSSTGLRLCETMSHEAPVDNSDATTTTTTTATATMAAWSNPLDVVMGKFDASAEAAFRSGLEDVYTTPLVDELPLVGHDGDDANDWELRYEITETRAFLGTFDINEKTEEIAAVLENNADTVRVFFESLVPVDVAYGDFWARYFFRCDASRIARAWIAYQNHLKEERRRTISSIKSTMVKASQDVIVYPTKTVLTTSLRLGSMFVNTALVPIGAIMCSTSAIVNSAGRLASANNNNNKEYQHTIPAPQDQQELPGKDRAKQLQIKLVETKRKLRQSEADAMRLRNQLLKAHDALQVRHQPPPKSPTAIIVFAEKRRPRDTLVVEDNTTSSSAITDDSFLFSGSSCDGVVNGDDDDDDDEWSASHSKGPLELDISTGTSVTAALDDSLSSAIDFLHLSRGY